MNVQLSRNHTLNRDTMKITEAGSRPQAEYEFDNDDVAVHIFIDRADGWFFRPAKQLLEHDHEVAAVHIVTPLIESLEEKIQGVSSKGQSAKFFKDRATAIFPNADPSDIDVLYSGVRCGFAHSGFIADADASCNVLISNAGGDALKRNPPILEIAAGPYVDAIRNAFLEYETTLQSNPQLRQLFLTIWKKNWTMCRRLPGAAATHPVTAPQAS